MPSAALGAGSAAVEKPVGPALGELAFQKCVQFPTALASTRLPVATRHCTPGDRMEGEPGPVCPPALPARIGHWGGLRPWVGEKDGQPSWQQTG